MVCTRVQVVASYVVHELDLQGCCNNVILTLLVSHINYERILKSKGNLLFVLFSTVCIEEQVYCHLLCNHLASPYTFVTPIHELPDAICKEGFRSCAISCMHCVPDHFTI